MSNILNPVTRHADPDNNKDRNTSRKSRSEALEFRAESSVDSWKQTNYT